MDFPVPFGNPKGPDEAIQRYDDRAGRWTVQQDRRKNEGFGDRDRREA